MSEQLTGILRERERERAGRVHSTPTDLPRIAIVCVYGVNRRLGNAKVEVVYGAHPGNFNKVITNVEVPKAYQEIVSYISECYGTKLVMDPSNIPPYKE